jgi:hypothetical protein
MSAGSIFGGFRVWGLGFRVLRHLSAPTEDIQTCQQDPFLEHPLPHFFSPSSYPPPRHILPRKSHIRLHRFVEVPQTFR